MIKKWELIHHENIETPYFEITNGPISLCIDEEDIPFEEAELCEKWCQIITDSLKIPYNIRSENKLELDQHITICVLQDEVAHLKETLLKIANWELPVTGKFWDDNKSQPVSYEAAHGSNGARDYIKALAAKAIKSAGSKCE